MTTSPRPQSFGGRTPEELIAIVRQQVRRVNRGRAHDEDDAVQETLARMLDVDANRFDEGRGTVEGLVSKRAVWTLRDMRRRQAAQGRLGGRFITDQADAGDLDAVPSAEAALTAAAADRARERQALAVRAAVAELERGPRTVIEACDLGGLSMRQLAQAEAVNVSTLSRRRAAGLQVLATSLASVAS